MKSIYFSFLGAVRGGEKRIRKMYFEVEDENLGFLFIQSSGRKFHYYLSSSFRGDRVLSNSKDLERLILFCRK